VLGPAIEATRAIAGGIDFPTEFCGDRHLVPDRLETFSDQLFVRVWAVDLRCVEERDAEVDCLAE
jgi:hypothetical protein